MKTQELEEVTLSPQRQSLGKFIKTDSVLDNNIFSWMKNEAKPKYTGIPKANSKKKMTKYKFCSRNSCIYSHITQTYNKGHNRSLRLRSKCHSSSNYLLF